MLRTRYLHLLSALAILLFLVPHMGNHLYGLTGQGAHMAYMHAARVVYRASGVEPVLILLIAWQALSGVFMVVRNWKPGAGAIGWLQAISGTYLALFLAIHLSAVIYGRAVLHLDTDFRYAAAGFHAGPWAWFFAPYYFLAVASLFAHLGCAAYWNIPDRHVSLRAPALGLCLVLGAAAGLSIDLSLAGKLYPVDIPAAYLATFSAGAPSN
jgi:hypothetical protein